MKKIGIIIGIATVSVFVAIILIMNPKNNYQILKYEYLDDNYYDGDKVQQEIVLLNDYQAYQTFIQKYGLSASMEEKDFKNNSFIVIFNLNACDSEKEISEVKYDNKNKKLQIKLTFHTICGLCKKHYNIYLYKIDKINDNNIKIEMKTEVMKGEECDLDVAYKPILYLYPNRDMNITVRLENKDKIITSYPKYENGWDVFVNCDGTINYHNRNYYALYWDEYNSNDVDFSEGFYVNREDVINFLEEKLDYIGLNNREANEFIMYWLPVLEKNEHTLVYFELTNEREENNKLYINPYPDSLLRINMHIKKVNGFVDIKEQKLVNFERKGFTVVEWGGTIHKEGNDAR